DGAGAPFSSWIQPLPLLIGAMFVASGGYLAPGFLLRDAPRAGEAEMERYFRLRASIAAVVAGVFAAVGLIALHSEARYVFDRLLDQGLPLVIFSALCGIGVIVAVLRQARTAIVRPLAAGAVVGVVWGWGVAQ